MKSKTKSSFSKLYLIEEELYQKILPLLNEMDRQELNNLNDDHKTEEPSNSNGISSMNLDSNTDEKLTPDMESKDIPLSPNPPNPETNTIEPKLALTPKIHKNRPPLQSGTNAADPDLNLTPPKTSDQTIRKMKPKKFECSHCRKGFTTKFSLKRHTIAFHSQPAQNENKEIDDSPKPVKISKYSNRYLKRKHQEVPETTNEENAYQKMPRIRGIKRTKITQTNDDATDIKQMRYEPGLTEVDYYAPRGKKRQIKREVDSQPNKKPKWVTF